jgi:hypothetical protein
MCDGIASCTYIPMYVHMYIIEPHGTQNHAEAWTCSNGNMNNENNNILNHGVSIIQYSYNTEKWYNVSLPIAILPNNVLPNDVSPNDILPNNVLPNNVLPNNICLTTFCLTMFCLTTFRLTTFCLKPFCLMTFCLKTFMPTTFWSKVGTRLCKGSSLGQMGPIYLG